MILGSTSRSLSYPVLLLLRPWVGSINGGLLGVGLVSLNFLLPSLRIVSSEGLAASVVNSSVG